MLVGAVLVSGVTAGCRAGGHSSSPATSRPAPATTTPATSTFTTSVPGPQTSGSRTVLSPIGLNVRDAPSTSARILGSAAQGVELTVLGFTASGGGWFKVKGATVTGWVSAQPTLTAAGKFRAYSSAQFAALYPAAWTESTLAAPGTPPSTSVSVQATQTSTTSPTNPTSAPPSSVVFRPATGAGDIVVRTANAVSQLPHGRTGYSIKSVSQVVACGITAGLIVFQQAGTPPGTSSAASVPESLPYLAEVRVAVDKQHALGLYADMPDLGATFRTFKEFVASLTFNAPQCSG